MSFDLIVVGDPTAIVDPTVCGGGHRIGIEIARALADADVKTLYLARGPRRPQMSEDSTFLDVGEHELVIRAISEAVKSDCPMLWMNYAPDSSLLPVRLPSGVFLCHLRSAYEWDMIVNRASRSTRWFFHSRWLEQDFKSRAAGLRTTAIPIGIAANRETPVVHHRSIDIAAAGALIEEKGFQDLLAAFLELRRRRPTTSLRIAGSRNLWGNSVGVPLDLPDNMPGFASLGPTRYSDMPQFWQEARVMVMPSRLPECLPLTVIEALAAGCRVVASDVPGNREILADGKFGQLYQAGDLEAMVSAIDRALRTPDSLQQMSARLRHAASFDWREGAMRVFDQLRGR